ncbi:MAG: FAD-binding and (Fe-S)-binding domain-containing protein [Deltaproteobacteria bacterium]
MDLVELKFEQGSAPRTRPVRPTAVDAEALRRDLVRALPEAEVRFDPGSRALYATDGSNYRHVPIGVVVPRSIEEVVRTMAVCREHGAPYLSRGGGTSLAGQCCNVAVVCDMSKYLRGILGLDPVKRLARVQPGCVRDDLDRAARRHGLTFAPDPSTHAYCTLGGMIGNNSCGVHSMMAGRTSDNVESLEVLTYDGLRLHVGRTSEEELERIVLQGGRRADIYRRLRDLRDRYAPLIRARFPKIPRRVSGYNLDELLPENGFQVARALVGTEGTCVSVLEATVRLVYSPPARTLVVLGFPDIYTAGDRIPEIRELSPTGLEGIDRDLVLGMKKKGLHPKDVQILPDGGGWLLVELGGESKADADAKARQMMAALKQRGDAPSMKLFDDPKEEAIVWRLRESGLGATARIPGEPDAWEGFEDAAVPAEKVGDYLRDFRKLLDRFHYNCALYGHLGQGCIHTRIDFDLKRAEGIAKYHAFVSEAADLVVRYGGSLSGEHGDGQSRAELLPKMFGHELVQAFREFKSIWDPEWKMNPGKVVDPHGLTQDLRYGEDYHPPQLPTTFAFSDDRGSFSYATERCVGVGKCRREEGGTMCPSYQVTHEEKHSTRGRAHLLFEMFQGDPLRHGFRDEAVREALDLCLSCKGCKTDCPMNVDMATYKAEFLSRFWRGRLRPRAAYAMGYIDKWARLAQRVPGLVNLIARLPILAGLVKLAGGIAQERELPAFARESFQAWFRRRAPVNPAGRPVLVWPDTFTDHFHPAVGKAAVELLESAGCQVRLPTVPLCCGRPLYDFGMLDDAKRYLRRILDALRPEIEAGVPLVGLEPSCLAVFKDELIGLFPNDEDAKRLSRQSHLLSDFLVNELDWQPPKLAREVVVHGHCHQKATVGMASDEALLARLGADQRLLETGCCGMAGSFGFEAGENYRVSMAVGEHDLLPKLRETAKDAVICASGFSCRTQIEQGTDRRGLHLAQVALMALREADAPGSPYPEARYRDEPARLSLGSVLLFGAALLAASALRSVLRRERPPLALPSWRLPSGALAG